MSEEHETIESRSSASQEVYQQTKFMAWFEKAFPWLLVGGAALGLVLMIFLPVIFFQEKTAEQLLAQSNLRLALLYTTGGVIAALGLLETYRKNTNDRAKANADIKAALKNQEHQAEVLKEQIRQFDDNAFKERKAERRERYTKAVEQLGDEKAPIRMGGVYTLVGLVDEWLEEKNLEYSERLKEGQVIINNLCAYIRSPFPLYARYYKLIKNGPDQAETYRNGPEIFYEDKSKLGAEIDIRLNIIKEIHNRLQGKATRPWGIWSNFEYNFSGSVFFYPVDLKNSYYKKPVNFSNSSYIERVNFEGSTYDSKADFSESIYAKENSFSTQTKSSYYKSETKFKNSQYLCHTDFSGSIYRDGAEFSGSIYLREANFTDSVYKGEANFSSSTYRGEADFSGSIFYREIYFDYSTYSDSSSRFLDRAPQFYDETNRQNTLFGSHNNDFTVIADECYPINLNSEGLPLGCKFLTSDQKEYLEDKFQEIEETKNKLREVKDDEEKAKLLDTLHFLNREIHTWRKEATTVKAEDAAPGEEDN